MQHQEVNPYQHGCGLPFKLSGANADGRVKLALQGPGPSQDRRLWVRPGEVGPDGLTSATRLGFFHGELMRVRFRFRTILLFYKYINYFPGYPELRSHIIGTTC